MREEIGVGKEIEIICVNKKLPKSTKAASCYEIKPMWAGFEDTVNEKQ